MSGQDWDTVTFSKKTKSGGSLALKVASPLILRCSLGAADQRTAEQARMSGMQVETVRKSAGNSSGGAAVSLSTLRRAEDDDSDAPMKREALILLGCSIFCALHHSAAHSWLQCPRSETTSESPSNRRGRQRAGRRKSWRKS